MTNEEIEKTLDLLIASGQPLSEVRNYINRLKAECADKERAYNAEYNLRKDLKRELVKQKEQVRKETAKECIEELEYFNSYEESKQVTNAINCLKEWARYRYGVEITE